VRIPLNNADFAVGELASSRALGQDGGVAAPEPKPASRRLLDAAAAERMALEEDLRSHEARRQLLNSELRSLEVEEREMRRRLQLVSELAGDHQPRALRAVPNESDGEAREVLSGASIRRIAGQIVARSEDPLRARHYTEWFQELVARGYAVAGRDPLAAFLTQLNRSPVVRRESKPGTYRLDFEVVAEIERQLLELNQRLARLHQGQQTIEGIASVRDERERITRSIDQLERTLAEAHATLHPA
jgi:hypothetical protein